ncbi:MFS transporter [Cohnella sp. GCM10027633]|uniref:MFS transporter n=1 Tax=unclassified Cohnella TaxID=2636738 RepID=UPI0036296948
MNLYLLLFVVFGGFLVFGLSENIKGPAIPRMQLELGLDEGQLGQLLALNSLGYLVACTFTSALARRIGIRWTGITAFASMTIAGFLIYLSSGYVSLTASYFLLYIGNGILEIGLAIMAARIFTKNTGTMMNIAHFFYGLSSTVAPILAASMMGWPSPFGGGDLDWRGMYAVVLALSLLPIIPALLGKFPEETHAEEGESASYRSLMRDPVAWLIVLILSFGVASELAIGSWLVNFLQKAYDWEVNDASGMLSLFFLFFMLARLVLGPITDRIGYTVSVLVFAALSGLCSLIGVLLGEPGAILLALAGIGIAPIYPTVMAMIAKRYPRGTDTAITFVVTLMGVASVICNLTIGYLIEGVQSLFSGRGSAESELLGMQAGYAFIGALAIACAICCALLYVVLRRRREIV